MKFEPGTMIYDVCRLIRDKLGIQGNREFSFQAFYVVLLRL